MKGEKIELFSNKNTTTIIYSNSYYWDVYNSYFKKTENWSN